MTEDANFFYGVQGVPFADAANAWFWTLDCLDAPDIASLYINRPCQPDDIVKTIRRLDLPPTHARTLTAWGKRRDEPPAGTTARRYWQEAMQRLTTVLQAQGIVRTGEPPAPPVKRSAYYAVDFRTIVGTGATRRKLSRLGNPRVKPYNIAVYT